jgi:anti-sigma B factor antagonist
MDIKLTKKPDRAVLEIKGEVDLYSSPLIRERCNQLIREKVDNLLINFKDVTYIDSSGLATLVEVLQKMRQYNGRLSLFALAQNVKNVFEVARLDTVFSIFESEEEALKN